MVYPVHANEFQFNILGRADSASFVVCKDLTQFQPEIENESQEWRPFDLDGWRRATKTGNGLRFTFTGKRNYGDEGNDYIAGLALLDGEDVQTQLRWNMPNGDVMTIDCIVLVTSFGGGESTDVDPLEFECISDGVPVVTTL